VGKQGFYKTIVKFEVLSEEPIPADYTLGDIHREAEVGHFVGRYLDNEESLLNGAAMADALHEAGSEPGFFSLDDAGESTADDEQYDFEEGFLD
jgi:hypothetical protein